MAYRIARTYPWRLEVLRAGIRRSCSSISKTRLYNFQRSHGGIDGLVPADHYFGAAGVLRTLKEQVAGNALDLPRHGVPKMPFYVTGQVAGKTFSVHAEGDCAILTRESRFHKLRGDWLQEAASFLESGRPGRPAKRLLIRTR